MKSGSKELEDEFLSCALERRRKFGKITTWPKHLDPTPKPDPMGGSRSEADYADALNLIGMLYVQKLIIHAKAGDCEAITDLAEYCCDMAEILEEIGEKKAETLLKCAMWRADWPVMLCRHETSAKPVAAYLDNIKLGSKCPINANGLQVAKYSLRTPINRFVWRELKGIRFANGLMPLGPATAGIDLHSLPKLTKAMAKTWADKLLMPYITATHENFSDVPELSAIISRACAKTRGQQRREIRKDVIRALRSLAPSA